jgi:hypothetical protein
MTDMLIDENVEFNRQDDYYTRFKQLQKQVELLEIQEYWVKEETKKIKIQHSKPKNRINNSINTSCNRTI